jgi:PTS system nitrogen regulatory IIA component
MSSLGDLLLPNAVVPRARWQGRRQVLQEMSATMARALDLDPREVFEAVLEREKLGSTGVGEGVAIPHARIDSLARPAGGFARLLEPADFDAIDERKADLVFMLLAPTDAGADHLGPRACSGRSRSARRCARPRRPRRCWKSSRPARRSTRPDRVTAATPATSAS